MRTCSIPCAECWARYTCPSMSLVTYVYTTTYTSVPVSRRLVVPKSVVHKMSCSLDEWWHTYVLTVPDSPTSPRTGPKGSQGRDVHGPEQGRGGGGGRPPGRDDYIVQG